MTNKYYAVKVGRAPGIYTSWADCQAQVTGYSNAVFRSFKTKQAAEEFLKGEKHNAPAIPGRGERPAADTCWAFVDGSFMRETKRYGYGGVLIFSDREETFSGGGAVDALAQMRNVAGEMMASMRAAQRAWRLHLHALTLFYDYAGIEKWPTEAWRAKNRYTQQYRDYMQRAARHLAIHYVKVPAHSGVYYNEQADALAKQGAREEE